MACEHVRGRTELCKQSLTKDRPNLYLSIKNFTCDVGGRNMEAGVDAEVIEEYYSLSCSQRLAQTAFLNTPGTTA